MRMEAAFSMMLSTSSTRGRSNTGGACTGNSLASWHQSHCLSLQGGYTALIRRGRIWRAAALVSLWMSVVHVKPKPCMETLMMVSVEHLVPFMNPTMLVQQELSLKSVFTGVEVPEERENPVSEVQEY